MSAGMSGEQMMKSWAEAQRQLLSNWLDMVRAAGGSGAMPDAKVWNQTVDSWRTAVMNTLDAQSIWTRTWIDSMLKTPGTPDGVQEMMRAGAGNIERWGEAQRELWQSWFDVMKETAKTATQAAQGGQASTRGKASAGQAAQAGEGLVDLWAATTRSLLDAQADWVRRWSDAIGDGESKN
ncbi:MAG TPA: hypothetical protein VFQ32_00025 [Ktedonobacterales bacterium]|nr:hypothetical protein [Ktedonobacterales bacterium]